MVKRKYATDHRAVVLESIATTPWPATRSSIKSDCTAADFTSKNVMTMVNQLQREGLVGKIESGYFLTRAGFSWLTDGRFDRALPSPHERPKGRGRKRTKPA